MALVVLSKSTEKGVSSTESLTWVTEPARSISLATPRILKVEKDAVVLVIFNSLAHSRKEVVSVIVSILHTSVTKDCL